MSFFSMDVTWIDALGWSLVHFLWQGALIALALELALACLRGGRADVRYALRCGALLLMAACPLATFAWLVMSPPAAGAITVTAMLPVEASRELAWQNAVVLLWSVGAAFFAARLSRDYLRIRRLQSIDAGDALPPQWQARFDWLSEALGVRAVARVVDSAVVAAPTVVGWLRPVVLVPARVLTGLSQEQTEALLAHELAHVRRHDFLVNLIQSALEALLFYHPAVWWVSNGIRAEREFCCDDVAMRVTDDRVSYARALTTLESWRGAPLQIGMSTTGGSLMHRIQRLVGVHPSRARVPLPALGALLLASTIGAAAVAAPAPQRHDDEARQERMEEIRSQINELQARLDELTGMLEEEHAATQEHSVRSQVGNIRAHGHDNDKPRSNRISIGGIRSQGHGKSNTGDVHKHGKNTMRIGGLKAQGDFEFDFGDDFEFDFGDDFEFDFEGFDEDIQEKIHKALEAHGMHSGDGKHKSHNIQVHRIEDLEDLEDLGQIHEHVQKALENQNFDFDFSELEDVHAQLKNLGKLNNTEFNFDFSELEDLHEQYEDVEHFNGDDFNFEFDFSELENLHEHFEDLHDKNFNVQLHGLENLKSLENLGSIHEHVQKALEAHGIESHEGGHGKHDFDVQIHGFDHEDMEDLHEQIRDAFEDQDWNVEVRGLEELENMDSIKKALSALEDLDVDMKGLDRNMKVHLKQLENLNENMLKGLKGRSFKLHGMPNVQIHGLDDLDIDVEEIHEQVREALESWNERSADRSSSKESNEVLQSVTPPNRKPTPII